MTSELMHQLQHLQLHIQQVMPLAPSLAIKPLQAMLKRLNTAAQALKEFDPEFDDEVVLEQARMVIQKSRDVLAEHSLLELQAIQTIDLNLTVPEVQAEAQLWRNGNHWQQLPSGQVHLDFEEVVGAVSGKTQSNDLNLWRLSLQHQGTVQVDLRLKP